MKLTNNLRCSTCKAWISWKWLFLSRRTAQYTCPVCKTGYEWNKSATSMDFTALIIGIFVIYFISSAYRYLPAVIRYGMGALVMAALIIGFTVFTPNQFTARPKEESSDNE